MADYLIKSTDKRTFTLLTAEATVRGELKYTKWFTFKSILALADGTHFRVAPKGRWGTTIEVKDEADTVLLSFKMNWNGSIVLKSRLGGENRDLVLKSQSSLKGSYALLDADGHDLLLLQPDYKWNKTNYDYSVVSTELFETFGAKDALVLTAVHCANYYMSMISSVMTTIITASM